MDTVSTSLRRRREEVLEDTSEEMLERHASLLDIAVISLYNRLVNRLGADAEAFREGAAALATGAFGRRLASPIAPIPLLLLTAEGFRWEDLWMDEVVTPLTEAGWTVEAVSMTIAEAAARAASGYGEFSALGEARHISGNRRLAGDLDLALDVVLADRRDDFLLSLHGAVERRKAFLERAENWLEPDVEGNPGGLSDIVALRAACRAALGTRHLEDAIFQGYLTREEMELVTEAERSFAHLAHLLRARGSGTVLGFEDQVRLAERLGVHGEPGFLPVEAFMGRVQRLFHGVRCVSQEFWARVQEGRLGGPEDEETVEIERGLETRSGKLRVVPARYAATPRRVVHVFTAAARGACDLSSGARRWLRHHRGLLDAVSGDAGVAEELAALLLADDPRLCLVRHFHDMGLLSALIPELAPVHGLVQYDIFHAYPVHEHHLRTLREMKRLMAGDYAARLPDLTAVARGLAPASSALLFSALLHDVGKAAPANHAGAGAALIPAIAARLGLAPPEAETLQFLVAHHLLLPDTASMRDITDETLLRQTAATVGTVERLDMLLVLSFADLAATGPRARRKWDEAPIISLYERLRGLLDRGEPNPEAVAERLQRVREAVHGELFGGEEGEALSASIEALPVRYLLSTPPAEIARHLRLERERGATGSAFIWEIRESGPFAEITMVVGDSPGLLSGASGVLSLHDLNIVEAQVAARDEGTTVLSFRCRLPEGAGAAVSWDAVRSDFARLLAGTLSLDYRIAARAVARPPAGLRRVPTRVALDNDTSEAYSILEVYTTDRVGVLYTITRTLVDLGIRVHVAKIATRVDQVADVFYVRTTAGGKLTDPEQITELERALTFWLDERDRR